MKNGARKKGGWSGYFRLIGIVLLVVILSRIELHKLGEILSRIDILYLLAAVLLNVPHFLLKALRWRSLLKMQNIDYSLKDSVLAYVGSVYFGFLTPGRLGEIVKAFHLVKDMGVPPARAMPSVIIDRLFDVYLLIILGTVGLWKFGLLGKVSNLAFLGLAVLAMAPFLLLNKRAMDRFVRLVYMIWPKAKAMEKLEAYYDDFYSSVRELLKHGLAIGGFLTILANLLFFLQCFCLIRSLGLTDLNYLTVVFLMAITVFITMLPISMAGIGTRDAILIFLFSTFGLEKELAVGFSILIFFSFYILGGLTGLACWLIKPVKLQKQP